jgi:drug/metabolite transporter (DMT)-like permease
MAAWLSLAAVQFAFATSPAVGRMALEGYSPYAMSFWRVTGAAVFFALLVLWREGRLPWPERGVRWRVAWLSLLGISLNQMLYLVGLSLSTAVRGGLLVLLIPILTTLWAVLRGAEQWDTRKALGVLSATAGVFALTGVDLLSGVGLGDLFFLANSTCYSIYLVEARPLLRRYSSLRVVTWVFWAALPVLALVPLCGVPLIPSDKGLETHAALLWIVLVPTIWSYLGNIIALRYVAASVAAIAICVQPVIAALLAVWLLDEQVHLRECVCFLLILAGVLLALMPKRHVGAPITAANPEPEVNRR